MNNFLRTIFHLKNQSDRSLHEIYFCNVEAYLVSWTNIAVFSVVNVPAQFLPKQRFYLRLFTIHNVRSYNMYKYDKVSKVVSL